MLVSDLDVQCALWLKLRLAPMCPWIGTISLAFVGPPAVKVQLSPYNRVRLMRIPVLQVRGEGGGGGADKGMGVLGCGGLKKVTTRRIRECACNVHATHHYFAPLLYACILAYCSTASCASCFQWCSCPCQMLTSPALPASLPPPLLLMMHTHLCTNRTCSTGC